jgi:hypothetical protein
MIIGISYYLISQYWVYILGALFVVGGGGSMLLWKVPKARAVLMHPLQKKLRNYGDVKDEEIRILMKEITALNLQRVRSERGF